MNNQVIDSKAYYPSLAANISLSASAIRPCCLSQYSGSLSKSGMSDEEI